MLPFVLVLLVASSALAAPSVLVSQYNINQIPQPSTSTLRGVIDAVTEIVDNADQSIYALALLEATKDLGGYSDVNSQALALAQTLAVLGELSTGIPGDACDAASLVNSYASGSTSVRPFLNRLASNIDNIVQLANNPNALRYSSGPRGNCAGGGRTYQFEAAWDGILNSASPGNIGLINEQYCSAKRLYGAYNIRSNNIGAAFTAASVPAVANAVANARVPIINFLTIAAKGGNAGAAAAVAKSALLA